MEYEIGIGKTGRRAYGLDEVAIVPSRRTRDPDDVDISWEIDAYTFPLPMMASAMDAGVSPATAIEVGRLGGLACLNLEGLQTRYEDPEPIFDEIASLPDEKSTRRLQELYKEPVKPELIVTPETGTSLRSMLPTLLSFEAELSLGDLVTSWLEQATTDEPATAASIASVPNFPTSALITVTS